MKYQEVLDEWLDLKILIKLLNQENKKLSNLREENHKLSEFRIRVIGEVLGDPKKNKSAPDELIFKALNTIKKSGRWD